MWSSLDLETLSQFRDDLPTLSVLRALQLICCVADRNSRNTLHSQDKFTSIAAEISTCLARTGCRTERIPFIPVSAVQSDNLTGKSDNTHWYTGPSLLEVLDAIVLKGPQLPLAT